MEKKAKKLLAAFLAAATALTLTACKNYKWATDKLPEPSPLKGSAYMRDDEYYSGYFSAGIECSSEYFQEYVGQCISRDPTAEVYYASDGSVYLCSADGSTATLRYDGEDFGDKRPCMLISLVPPITLGNAEWQDSTAAAQIPKPSSDLFGQARAINDDKRFFIYVGNTPHSDFLDYIERCKEAGFTDITTEDDVSFEANNDEYSLYISYAGVNVMYVSVTPK